VGATGPGALRAREEGGRGRQNDVRRAPTACCFERARLFKAGTPERWEEGIDGLSRPASPAAAPSPAAPVAALPRTWHSHLDARAAHRRGAQRRDAELQRLGRRELDAAAVPLRHEASALRRRTLAAQPCACEGRRGIVSGLSSMPGPHKPRWCYPRAPSGVITGRISIAAADPTAGTYASFQKSGQARRDAGRSRLGQRGPTRPRLARPPSTPEAIQWHNYIHSHSSAATVGLLWRHPRTRAAWQSPRAPARRSGG
jgi:hypothetical protein